jgi:transcriptional regulator with XRE-family HTH domain
MGLAEEADEIDRAIGARLRHLREARGMTLAALGGAVGVTSQQMFKYERASNRVSSSMLVLLARALSVPPLDLLAPEETSESQIDWSFLSEEELHELIKHYRRISDPRFKRAVSTLARSLAASEQT